jgi:hypothetical protein
MADGAARTLSRTPAAVSLAAAAAAGVAVAFASPGHPWALAGTLAAAALAIALGRIVSVGCAPGRLDFFAPHVAFPLAYLVWFGVASLPILRDLDPPRALTPVMTEWPIYALGLFAYALGVWIAERVLGRAPATAGMEPSQRFDPRRLFVACLVVFLAAAATTAAIYARRGVPLLAPKIEAARLAVVSSGYERLLFMGFATTAMLVLAHAARERFRIGLRFWALLGLSLLALGSTGDRGLVVLPIAAGVVLAHYLWRPLGPAKLAIVLVPLLAFASVTVLVRGKNTYGAQYVPELHRLSRLPPALLPALPIYQGIWSGPNVFHRLRQAVPSEVDYGYGAYAAAPLVSFLPGSQEWAAEAIKRFLDDRFIGQGQPATLLGAFYLDFGYAGIAAGMATAGFLLAALYRRLRQRRDLFTAILYAHASFLVFLSLYGDLYNGNPLLIWNGALSWIACRFAARPAKAEA